MPHVNYLGDKYPDGPVAHKSHCCGAMEIDCLGKAASPLAALIALGESLFKGSNGSLYLTSPDRAARIVMFTGTVGTKNYLGSHDGKNTSDYGQAFADFIVANNFGEVVSTKSVHNWTANSIKMWAWTPNHDTLWPFLTDHGLCIGKARYERDRNPPQESVVLEEPVPITVTMEPSFDVENDHGDEDEE